jgi:glycerophosphoryl diester phosphodiesterase
MRHLIRVGHRGAGAYAPDNTLASFRRALEIGVDMIETDVRVSRDGHLVLAHDAEMGPPGHRLAVAATDWAELRRLDLGGGERPLILEDAFEVARGRCGLMIDLKGEGFEEPLVRAIQSSGLAMSDVIVPGGSALSRGRIRALDAAIPLSLSLGHEWDDRITPEFIAAIDTDAVTWNHHLIAAERVAALQAQGLTVYTWTVDTPERVRFVHEAGVDGIISNRPDLLQLEV